MLHLLLAVTLAGQEPQRPPPPPPQEALRVYLNCGSCDLDFLRTEITFVNYVRDRHDAQVYLLVSTQRTGAGGTEYTLTFIGQQEFEGRADTLRYAASPDATDDMVRRGLAHAMTLGLVRYVAQTPVAEEIEIRRRPPGPGVGGPEGGPSRQGHDPWNYWVFTASVNGNLYGESTNKYSSIYEQLSANRTTESSKLELRASASTSRSAYQITDTSQFVTRRRSYSFSSLMVRSLGGRWSAGGRARVSSSTYTNQDLALSLGPAIEYDLFPYVEATRRQLRFNYSLGVSRFDYNETTLYGKTAETLLSHSLDVALGLIERWGSVNISLEGSEYFHDLRKYNAGISGGASLRLVRGLSFNAYAYYSRVHDQLYLPAGGATPEEIIARQRQLATQYYYSTFFGLSYTFGSIYSNVVNPRFGSSGGSGMTISF